MDEVRASIKAHEAPLRGRPAILNRFEMLLQSACGMT